MPPETHSELGPLQGLAVWGFVYIEMEAVVCHAPLLYNYYTSAGWRSRGVVLIGGSDGEEEESNNKEGDDDDFTPLYLAQH